MEAATIRSMQQVGPTGQRADSGPSPQPPPPGMSYQQRVQTATAAQIQRTADTTQSFSKGGPLPSQSVPRSAASPLSPPRPGPGAAGAANYPSFAGAPAREAPVRYVQNSSYVPAFIRDASPFPRVSQVQQVVTEYRQVVPSSVIGIVGSQHPPPVVSSVPLSVGSCSNATTLLKVDTRESPVVMVPSGAYHPQVEAISPTLPSDPMEELRATKDELLQQIAKVDNEIDKAEKKIASLKKKQESLEEASAKPPIEESSSEAQPKHRNLAQKIYAENRKRASAAHAVLSTLCSIGADPLPLYNQPSDAEVCREVQERHQMFKQRLLLHFRKIKTERAAKQCEITERYAQLSQEWTKRVDKLEASAKRKAKEAKNREFFEKVFPELRKQREDKERFNRVGSRIKSEADLEEIMDGLQEQAMEDKKMRSYAVIPPLMLDSRQRRLVFNNENGALIDMETEFKDCVRYYYLSKKTENYKQLLRKSRQRTRSSRNPQKSNQQQTQSIVDAMTTGVTTSSTTTVSSANESNVNSNGANVSNSTTGEDSTEGSTKINENEMNASTGAVMHTTTGTTAAVTTVTSAVASGDGSLNNDPAIDALSSKSSNSVKAVSGSGIISTTTSSGKVDQQPTAQPTVTGPANVLSVENSIGVSYVIPSATIALSNIPINGVKPDLLSLNSKTSQSLPSTVELTLGSVVASVVSSKLGSGSKDDLQHLKEEINSSDPLNKRKEENINESSNADIQEGYVQQEMIVENAYERLTQWEKTVTN
uniref:N-CoR GPS2-interacting domain-containing protein n=1 Tax=Anopheles culicifacies TaxID=139723 RepID=A0A182MT82_9DIPT